MTGSSAPPPPPQGRPGPRWGGDGALDRPPPPDATPESAPPPEPPEVDGLRGDGRTLPYATFRQRLLAFLVDEVAKALFYAVVVFPVILSVGAVAPPDIDQPLTLLPQLLLGMGFDWIFWAQGWTPGTRLLRLRIVRADGSPPGMRRALVRVLVSRVSNLAFFAGHVWMLWDRRKQTWQDKVGGTFVVDVRDSG